MHIWLERYLEVEYNDPHKYHSKLYGFPFTSRTNTVAIYGSKKFHSHKWPIVLVDEVNRKTVQFRGMFVWIIVFYFYNIFLTSMHFIKNGYKRFSKTNSTDPRQRVPLNVLVWGETFMIATEMALGQIIWKCLSK